MESRSVGFESNIAWNAGGSRASPSKPAKQNKDWDLNDWVIWNYLCIFLGQMIIGICRRWVPNSLGRLEGPQPRVRFSNWLESNIYTTYKMNWRYGSNEWMKIQLYCEEQLVMLQMLLTCVERIRIKGKSQWMRSNYHLKRGSRDAWNVGACIIQHLLVETSRREPCKENFHRQIFLCRDQINFGKIQESVYGGIYLNI